MQRVKISLLCLLSLSLAGVLAAQTAVDPNSDVGSASLQDFSGGATLSGTYFDVRYMSGSGVGYQNGYTQIGAFTPIWLSEDAFIAPNARILLTDNSGIGANLGLVARRYDSERDRIWGINGYFDTDETNFNNRYNQLGLGVESLGQFFDFRANGYVPFGTDKNFIREVGLSNVPFFFENRIGFIGTRLMEQGLRGADVEAGVPVTPQTPWLRAYAGGYAYQQDGGKDPVGVRARLEGWVSNDLSLGVTTTWDEQFGTNVNFVADWRFAGFLPTRYFPQWTTRERMLMPVQRQWRVTAGNFLEDHNVLAFNPRDNQPYFVVWVDNSATAPGDGTFENPFTTLPPTVPNGPPDQTTDLVLVRRGNTTELAPLNGSITLPDYARMLGEGKAHIFDAYADSGPFHVTINDQVLPDPAFNDPVNAFRYPFLTNTNAGLNGGDIIRVGSHNEVSAFVLEGATGRAIFGNAAPGNNVDGFHFNNLEITNNIGGGIRLVNATGTGLVTLDGQIIDSGVLRDINRNPVVGWSYAGTGLGDNAAGGIFVDTGVPALTVDITNVSMNANPASQLFGINMQADDGNLKVTLTNVEANGVSPAAGNTIAGIILGETNRALRTTLTNVSASNNTGDGLQVTGTGGSIGATIEDSASVFNNNGGSGIVYSQTGGTGTFDMFSIQANDNGLDGLGIFGSAATVMNANVHNSFLTGNTRDGIHVVEVGGATVNLLVDTTDVSGNNRDGLFFNVGGGSTLNATFIDTNLSDNGRHGIRGIVTGNSLVNLSLTDSPVDRSGRDGFFFNVDASTMNVTAVRSSFSNSGVVGPTGNGIVGDVTTAGLVTFDFTNTPGSNNLDNGLFVRTFGLSNFQGTFSNSPFDDNGNTTGGDGIRLDLDNSPNSSLVLTGGLTTINRNGRHGFELNATNGTVFTNTFTGTQIVDNGQDVGGDGVQVNVDNSTVTQTFNLVNITNTILPGTQEDGYEFNVSNGGDLTATFTGGSLSDHLLTATRGFVTGAGSSATVSLSGVAADRSGFDGANLQVTAGGELTFSATNNTSFSNSGGSGINVDVIDTASVANFELDQVFLDDNGGHGFRGFASTEGTLNACITQTSIQRNVLNGINLFFQGPGVPTTGNFHVENTTVDGNGEEGLLASAFSGAQLNYRSVNTTYNTNGASGVFDGVQVNADGAGTRVLTLFSGGSANDNTDDGYEFNATNGAILTAELDNTTATGNAGYGVNFNATGAGTNAALLMTGNNTFAGNTLGPFNINVTGVDQIVLSISGTFDDSPGDGIFIDIVNATSALVAVQGPGTVDRSGQAPFPGPSGNGDGIDLRMTNVTNASILISGFTSIDDSAADGIHIEMDTIASGALEINGQTSITNSGDDAIDISLLNTTLDGAPVLAATVIDHLTLVDSLVDDPLTPFDETCLPAVVSVTLDSLGLVAEPFTINAMQIDNSANRGISVSGVDSTISTLVLGVGTGRITNNIISDSLAGDGLVVILNNTALLNSADGLLVDGNSSSNNFNNGFNFDFTNAPADSLTITNNIGGVSVNTGLGFTIIGNTFPIGLGTGNFNLINTSSTPTADIVSFSLDTSTSVSGALYNTETGAFFPFTPFGGTDTTTGLLTVNGTPVPPYPNNLVPDFTQFLGLTFNDFQPGENFAWDIDADLTAGGDESVFGNDLIGSIVNVGFTGGLFLGGSLVAVPGDPSASTFVATSGNIGGSGIATNGLDGIRFDLNNSSLTNLNISGNQIEANTAHGINFRNVVNSDISTGTTGGISNNTIDGNGNHGFRLINPNTAGAPIDLAFNDNTITNNSGTGIITQVNNNEVLNISINSVATGNQISNNLGTGINVAGANNAQVNLTMGGTSATPNTLNANDNAGVSLTLLDNAVGTLDVSNTTVSGTVTGQGLVVRMSGFSSLSNAVIGDPVLSNTNFTGNGSHGVDFGAAAFSQLTNPLVQNVTSSGNTGDGLHFQRDGNANITGAIINNNTLTANSDGIDISAQFALTTDDYTITNNLIDSNTVNGIRFNAQADASINTILTNNVITNNADNGILITTVSVSPGDAAEVFSGLGAWTDNTIDTNGQTTGANGAGIQISGFHTITLGTLANGNTINTNAGDGIEITAPGTLDVVNATIRFNNTSGSADGLAGIDLNSTGGNTLSVSNSNISNNLGDGLELDNTGVFTTISLTDNLIQFNSRDGVEFMDQGFFGGLFIQGTAPLANQIVDNGFRGVDIVVAGFNPTSSVAIDNTDVLRNGQEGIYTILTSDAAQTNGGFRDNVANVALANGGAVGSTPFLTLDLTNNRVNQNGQLAGNIGGSGILLRVGTTGRNTNNFNDPGGFATGANGGVISTMTGNSLTGNFGADVLFESFTSTVDPNTTGGTWTDQNENPRNFANDTFNPTGYQADPIARLDLVFNNNVGDELNATRQGASYNNNEPIFKSRTQGQDNGTDGGIDDPGPFGSGARLRNAQRLAARFVDVGGTKLDPQLSTGLSDLFLYPGMGQSTFRVDLTGGNIFGLPTATSDFLLDNNPYVDFLDANGNPLTSPQGGPTGIDNMPWGWSVLP